MKKIIYFLIFIALVFSVRKVSAATEVVTLKATACIVTNPSTTAFYHRQWGVKAGSASVRLGCSIALPKRAYSSIVVTVSGYQRVGNGLIGDAYVSDNLGNDFEYAVGGFHFPLVQAAGQVVSRTINLNSSFSNPNQFLYLDWVLYSGENYLTSIEVSATY